MRVLTGVSYERMLQERRKSILHAVIQEYIRTAHPVASRELARDSAWGLSPATIRNELLALDDEGFLEQPHTSSGRVPTDKGYRYFLDHLLTDAALPSDEEESLREAFAIRHADEFIREFARRVSKIAGAFATAGMEREHVFYKSGFAAVLEEPEFADPERARGFAHLADFLDVEIARVLRYTGESGQTWIGEENPWREARPYAMTLVPWEHPAGFSGFISIVAPRRANYPKHKAIINLIRTVYDA